MGEADRRVKADEMRGVLVAKKYAGMQCVYCANAAETEEHMPPRIMFLRKDRPPGLEFPACRACNAGTSRTDQVASLIGRSYSDIRKDGDLLEFEKLLRAVRNNEPGLLEEMEIGRGGQKIAAKRYGGLPEGAGFLRLDGPILVRHMTVFAAKMGFALFYAQHGRPIPMQALLRPMYFSNVQARTGDLPHEILDLLPPQVSLNQGKKEVFDQFTYAVRVFDDKFTVSYATFRGAFATLGVVYHDKADLNELKIDSDIPLFSRGLDAEGRSSILSFERLT